MILDQMKTDEFEFEGVGVSVCTSVVYVDGFVMLQMTEVWNITLHFPSMLQMQSKHFFRMEISVISVT